LAGERAHDDRADFEDANVFEEGEHARWADGATPAYQEPVRLLSARKVN
jgi:hypothetical protein